MSVNKVADRVNQVCRREGGAYAHYSCKYVSWDDAARGTVGGGLSCWGPNITDTYLRGKDGQKFFTVRSDNWNEKLGCMSADKIAVVVGNHTPGGKGQLKPVTLRSFLKNFGAYGSYAGVPAGADLSNDDLDAKVSVRFQTTFLPVASDNDKAAVEFCTEAYNYNTRSDDNPRNLVVLATTQGIAIQQDGCGTKRILHHAVDDKGVAHQYWLEAERSTHQVGGPQKETEEERADAAARGKATAAVIGVPAMGTRFNALLTVQIPLKMARSTRVSAPGMTFSLSAAPCMAPMAMFAKKSKCVTASASSSSSYRGGRGGGRGGGGVRARRGCCARGPVLKEGASNAARVSRGTEAGVYKGLRTERLERDPAQHMTVTIVLYNTVAGGVPTVEDVKAAIDDMENLYKQCAWSGRLADQGADFMKGELTVKDAMDIQQKIDEQPYKPTVQPVADYDTFPTDD